jgi:hypothetical protein
LRCPDTVKGSCRDSVQHRWLLAVGQFLPERVRGFFFTPCLPGVTGIPRCYGTQYEKNAIGHNQSRCKPVHMYSCLEHAVGVKDAAVPDMWHNFIFHVCLCHVAVISQSCGRCIQTSFVRNSGFVSEVLLSVHRILDECIWNTGKMIVYTG